MSLPALDPTTSSPSLTLTINQYIQINPSTYYTSLAPNSPSLHPLHPLSTLPASYSFSFCPSLTQTRPIQLKPVHIPAPAVFDHHQQLSNDLLVVEQTLDAVHLHNGCHQNSHHLHSRQPQHLIIVSLLPLQETPLPLISPRPTPICRFDLLVDRLQLLRRYGKVLILREVSSYNVDLCNLLLHTHLQEDLLPISVSQSYKSARLGLKVDREGPRDVDLTNRSVVLQQIRPHLHLQETLLVRVVVQSQITACLRCVDIDHQQIVPFPTLRSSQIPLELVRLLSPQTHHHSLSSIELPHLRHLPHLNHHPLIQLALHLLFKGILLHLLEIGLINLLLRQDRTIMGCIGDPYVSRWRDLSITCNRKRMQETQTQAEQDGDPHQVLVLQSTIQSTSNTSVKAIKRQIADCKYSKQQSINQAVIVSLQDLSEQRPPKQTGQLVLQKILYQLPFFPFQHLYHHLKQLPQRLLPELIVIEFLQELSEPIGSTVVTPTANKGCRIGLGQVLTRVNLLLENNLDQQTLEGQLLRLTEIKQTLKQQEHTLGTQSPDSSIEDSFQQLHIFRIAFHKRPLHIFLDILQIYSFPSHLSDLTQYLHILTISRKLRFLILEIPQLLKEQPLQTQLKIGESLFLETHQVITLHKENQSKGSVANLQPNTRNLKHLLFGKQTRQHHHHIGRNTVYQEISASAVRTAYQSVVNKNQTVNNQLDVICLQQLIVIALSHPPQLFEEKLISQAGLLPDPLPHPQSAYSQNPRALLDNRHLTLELPQQIQNDIDPGHLPIVFPQLHRQQHRLLKTRLPQQDIDSVIVAHYPMQFQQRMQQFRPALFSQHELPQLPQMRQQCLGLRNKKGTASALGIVNINQRRAEKKPLNWARRIAFRYFSRTKLITKLIIIVRSNLKIQIDY